MEPEKNKFERSKKRVTFDESVNVQQELFQSHAAQLEAERREQEERNEREFEHFRQINGHPFQFSRDPNFDPRRIAEAREDVDETLGSPPRRSNPFVSFDLYFKE